MSVITAWLSLKIGYVFIDSQIEISQCGSEIINFTAVNRDPNVTASCCFEY